MTNEPTFPGCIIQAADGVFLCINLDQHDDKILRV